MKGLLWLGKWFALMFWALVLVNLAAPLVSPFQSLVNLAAVALLVVRGLELLMFKNRLRDRRRPLLDRLLIVLLGSFHILSIPTPTVREIEHA